MTDAFEKSLSRLVFEVARLHRNRAAALLSEIGLHPGQETVLKLLAAEDGRTMGELAAALGVQAPTVTKMVSRLAERGLLERRQAIGDARQARVHLTPKGRKRAARIDKIWKALDKEAFADFDAKDKKRLKKLLDRMRDNLDGSALLEEPQADEPEDPEPSPQQALTSSEGL